MARYSKDEMREARAAIPKTIEAYNAMARALWTEGSLDNRLREMLRLRSAQLAQCQH